MGYSKPWISYEDQLNQLIARGLIVEDYALAVDYLERIGYYRLSGYLFSFRERSGDLILLNEKGQKPKSIKIERISLDEFKGGATFRNGIDLYVFDKKLRLLALDALERIEIAIRVDVAHTLGKIDSFAYLKPDLLHSKFSELDVKTGLSGHYKWLGKQAALISRSKEEFIKHNKDKYGLPLPIWVSCEVWDFGALSMLYSGMQERDQDTISKQYGISNGRIFTSWLRCLNYLRNVCAHHSRLWNRNISEQPKLPTVTEVSWVRHFDSDTHARARCFLLLCIASYLLKSINPNSSWTTRLREHLQSFPDLEHLGLNLYGMGAPEGWELMLTD